MKNIKKLMALLLVLCLCFGIVGCAGDAYDNFKPASVEVVDYIGDTWYEYVIDDEKTAKRLWQRFDGLTINEDPNAKKGTAYLYLEFYNADKSTKAIFTIYENGVCCLGKDYETLYTVEKGRSAYIDLCEIYESYDFPEE